MYPAAMDGQSRTADRDHDAVRIAASLMSGRSVVVVGDLGSGKTHLLTTIGAEVVTRVEHAAHIHAGTPSGAHALRQVLRSNDGRRSNRAHQTAAPGTILLIDDAEDLDEESFTLVADAVFGRRLSVLFAIAGHPLESSPRARGVLDLWLRGLADRHDLRRLDSRVAEESLAGAADDLDAVTRSAIAFWSHGSRVLLRELASGSTDAVVRGEDPLRAVGARHSGTPLADALSSHVARFDDQTARALAFFGAVPGIRHSDATRFVPRPLVDEMVARDMIGASLQSEPRLVANPILARAAARRFPEPDLLREAVQRMLRDGRSWWSPSIGAALAAECFSGALSEVGIRVDVLSDSYAAAAVRANDSGDYGLARDYCLRGRTHASNARVEVELARALSGLGRIAEAVGVLSAVEPENAAVARHLVRAWGEMSHHTGFADHRPDARMAADSRWARDLSPELALFRAETYALRSEWGGALESATIATTAENASPPTRLLGFLTVAYAHAHSGKREDVVRALRDADRVCEAGGGRPGVPASAWLTNTAVQIGLALITGAPARDLAPRASRGRRLAVRQGDPLALSLAGFASGLVAIGVDDIARARVDIRDARIRQRALPPSLLGPIFDYSYAPVLAAVGEIERAWEVLHDASSGPLHRHLLVRHTALRAEAQIHAAGGDTAEARRVMDSAIEISCEVGATVAYVHDVCQRAALGELDPAVLDRARDAVREAGIDHLDRLLDGVETTGLDLIGRSAGADAAVHVPARLTGREREIAALVRDGLSNRDIAERLYLSVRTVETYVYQARSKIGASSRRDLGNRLR